MGGIASIFSSKPKPRTAAMIITDDTAARRAKDDEKRKKMAFKLAQLATGAGGIFSEASTSKKKLLGN